jgi:hypothetical protein
MAKTETRGHKQDDRDAADERCILCEAIIETGDHEIFFATGYCRYCQAVLEEEPSTEER